MTIQNRKIKRYKFGSLSKYKGYEYNIYLMIEPVNDMIDFHSWFQVEIEKGDKLWAMTLDKKQTISNAQNKILDYIDKLNKEAINQQ